PEDFPVQSIKPSTGQPALSVLARCPCAVATGNTSRLSSLGRFGQSGRPGAASTISRPSLAKVCHQHGHSTKVDLCGSGTPFVIHLHRRELPTFYLALSPCARSPPHGAQKSPCAHRARVLGGVADCTT